jgi:hypothetical protein
MGYNENKKSLFRNRKRLFLLASKVKLASFLCRPSGKIPK